MPRIMFSRAETVRHIENVFFLVSVYAVEINKRAEALVHPDRRRIRERRRETQHPFAHVNDNRETYIVSVAVLTEQFVIYDSELSVLQSGSSLLLSGKDRYLRSLAVIKNKSPEISRTGFVFLCSEHERCGVFGDPERESSGGKFKHVKCLLKTRYNRYTVPTPAIISNVSDVKNKSQDKIL